MKSPTEPLEPQPLHSSTAQPEVERPRPALQGSVLVAAESVSTQRVVTSSLQGTGVTLRVVDNGLQAVQAALSQAFDLLILNIQMPMLDGVSALGLLRRAGYRGAAIALSADGQPEEVAQLRRLGFQEVLADPIDLPRLHGLLSRFLAGACDPHTALAGDGAAAVVHRLAAEFTANRRGGLQLMKALYRVTPPDTPSATPTI
jgi:CheY-like chemotaxis protein